MRTQTASISTKLGCPRVFIQALQPFAWKSHRPTCFQAIASAQGANVPRHCCPTRQGLLNAGSKLRIRLDCHASGIPRFLPVSMRPQRRQWLAKVHVGPCHLRVAIAIRFAPGEAKQRSRQTRARLTQTGLAPAARRLHVVPSFGVQHKLDGFPVRGKRAQT